MTTKGKQFLFYISNIWSDGLLTLWRGVTLNIHAGTHPLFSLFTSLPFHILSIKDHFQWAIRHPLPVIEFWYEGNYSSLKLFALIWNINEFFWARAEIWSQRSSITPGWHYPACPAPVQAGWRTGLEGWVKKTKTE